MPPATMPPVCIVANVPFLLPISVTTLNSSDVLSNDGYGILNNDPGEGINAVVATIEKENY